MNCSTCHNPHATERNVQAFSKQCMSCHKGGEHKTVQLPQEVLARNCVDSHMPNLPSGKITLLTNGTQAPTPDSMRTHLITVYPEKVYKRSFNR